MKARRRGGKRDWGLGIRTAPQAHRLRPVGRRASCWRRPTKKISRGGAGDAGKAGKGGGREAKGGKGLVYRYDALPLGDGFGYNVRMAGICGHKILRWLRPTPDRLVLAVLALEGFLVLSERFQWFAFNQHKGWTVLIAVASVGVFFLLMFLWFFAAVLFRLRFQYRPPLAAPAGRGCRHPVQLAGGGEGTREKTEGGSGGDYKGRWERYL